MVRWGNMELEYLVSDVDGVLTDGRYYYSEGGMVFKGFHCSDSVAVKLAKHFGLTVVFVTSGSETSRAISKRRAVEIGVALVEAQYGFKERAVQRLGVGFKRMAYVGDSVDDIPLLDKAAVAFVPAGSLECVSKRATYVLSRRGGEGCLLEVLETLGLLDEK
ncbi:hypothetical protein ACFLXE_00285 [Chloroflexota bacterium]